jgi:hypothetical protein
MGLSDGVAAFEREDDTGDVDRRWRREEDDRLGEVRRVAEQAGRDLGEEGLAALRGVAVAARRGLRPPAPAR